MKIRTVKSNEERSILTGMIVDPIVLSRVASKWGKRGNLFRSEWSNMVAGWCVGFHRQYSKAPKKAISGLYHRWAEKSQDKHTKEMVEKFLVSLSNDYKALARESNTDYVTDLAARYFTKVKLEKLNVETEELLELGEVEKASKAVESYGTFDMGSGSTTNVFQDKDALREAFKQKDTSLIEYAGAMGQFVGRHFRRGNFIALLGPEKRGKSYWLGDIGYRAMCQRRKVAHFVLGDMEREEVLMRYAVRCAKRPEYPDTVRWPVSIKRGPKGIKIKTKSHTFRRGLDWRVAWKAFQEVQANEVRSHSPYLKLSVHAADTISVAGIDDQLKLWAQEGWVPDVIIIDYADNLDMGGVSEEYRHQINRTWKALRKLAQTWKALVVTATQANAEGGETELITRKHFSEDKRKLAHVTGMIGLNQTTDEKEQGIYRLNWVLLRGGRYSDRRCVKLAGCLELGNPCVRSCW
jgi:hypothetical protein